MKYNAVLEATFGYQTKARRLELGLPKAQVIDAMGIAAGDRDFGLPPGYLVERRIKARLPYHRFSNENKKGKTCVKTPVVRQVFGFKLDVGYSHVKAVTPTNRLLIPSVVATYKDLPLADLSKNGTGYIVDISYVNGTQNRYFVGEMALKEGHAASFSLDREKHRHLNHDILVFTAAKGLNSTPGDTLVAGLPVAYYHTQKEKLQEHLQGLHAEVSINGQKMSRISFGKVLFPWCQETPDPQWANAYGF